MYYIIVIVWTNKQKDTRTTLYLSTVLTGCYLYAVSRREQSNPDSWSGCWKGWKNTVQFEMFTRWFFDIVIMSYNCHGKWMNMAHLVRWWSFTYDFDGDFSIATFNCSSGVCFFRVAIPQMGCYIHRRCPTSGFTPLLPVDAWSRAWIGAAYLEYVTCRVRPETEESKHPEVSEDEVILPPQKN